MQSTESSSLDGESSEAPATVASSTNQVKSSYLNSALSAVRTEPLGPAATPSGPPATTRLLPSATPSKANVPRDVVTTSSVVEGKVSKINSHIGFHSSLGRV